jgi:hypothetical protein
MKQSRKDFIKQAHENACSDWKKNIEKEFPKLFKKDSLVRGWSKIKGDEFALAFIQGIEETYGFDYKGRWTRNWCENIGSTKYTPATDKEVEQALIKEAKKRGFKKGVEISYLDNTTNSCGFDGTLMFLSGILVDKQHATIFSYGKWAKIVKETITKEQAEKELGKIILN